MQITAAACHKASRAIVAFVFRQDAKQQPKAALPVKAASASPTFAPAHITTAAAADQPAAVPATVIVGTKRAGHHVPSVPGSPSVEITNFDSLAAQSTDGVIRAHRHPDSAADPASQVAAPTINPSAAVSANAAFGGQPASKAQDALVSSSSSFKHAASSGSAEDVKAKIQVSQADASTAGLATETAIVVLRNKVVS